MDLGLTGRVVLVTGAGRHIGRQIAHEFAAEGAKIAVNDIFPDRATSVVDEIRHAGGTAVPVVADITDRSAVDAMLAKIRDELGPVEVLVNNAGLPARSADEGQTTPRETFVEADPATWRRWVDLNLYGTLNCTRACLLGMREHNWGRVISIISEAGRVGESGLAVYAGVKAGIVGFSKSVAREMARYGVTANCVSLGATVPEERAREWGSPEQIQERMERFKRNYPLARALDRLGLPEDASYTVVMLASRRAEWITGQTVSVSGGFTML